MSLTVHVPTRTVSEPNVREHWAVRNKRKQQQQRDVFYAWKAAVVEQRAKPSLPCVVRLTRFGPRMLDSDNLAASFKGIRDQVAKLLKVDDGDKRIRFQYDQRVQSNYAVTIQVDSQ
jgi:hypothetical protein